jgi:hypothetical protein
MSAIALIEKENFMTDLQVAEPPVEHKSCYGLMFPDPLHAGGEGWNAGKAFHLMTSGPTGMVRLRPHVVIDHAAWEDCVHCPAFEHCYKRSMAKLALETAAACS